jgi:hypothetical protein
VESNARNIRLHFRYHDGAGSYFGVNRWRYEVITLPDLESLIKNLSIKGYDCFATRLIGTTDSWVEHSADFSLWSGSR